MRPLTVALPLLVLISTSAWAADPKFDFQKPEEKVEGPVWKAQARAGALVSTGNARSTSVSAGFTTSLRTKQNLFTGEANLAYVRSTLLLAVDENTNGVVDPGEVQRLTQVTSESWLVQARYDRFLGESNTLFISARSSSDVPAGKELVGGGQLGYSRRLYKTEASQTFIEAGYDFQYEKYAAVEAAVSIHSARGALNHSTKFAENSLISLEAEVLTNLNAETAPNPEGGNIVDPFNDTRINVGARMTSTLTERIGLGFNFKLRYDNVPAPRPPFALPFAEGFLPFADKLDSVIEASVIVTLL